MIKDYYQNKFRNHLNSFLPDQTLPYFGHGWSYDCGNLNKIRIEERAEFLFCLYFTVLVDQAMFTNFPNDYNQFEKLTKYPKFCHGLGQFQKNPRDILLIPTENGMVKKVQMEKVLIPGMELFVNEIIDFFQNYMKQISPADFFEKLMYDPDVQIPELLVILDPNMKKDIVVQAYEALRSAINKIFKENA